MTVRACTTCTAYEGMAFKHRKERCASCYGACVHQDWSPAELSRLIDQITADTGMSQRALAKIAGVHHSQISRWKSGGHQPGYDRITRLATGITEARPEIDPAIIPALYRAAGYGAGFTTPPPSVRQQLREIGDVIAEHERDAPGNDDDGTESGSGSP